MRTMTRDQFVAYANRQIATAEAMLRTHGPASPGWCSCGKQQPCSIAATCRGRIEHFEGKLALLDATTVLPVVAPEAEPRRARRRRRWLLGGVR